MRVWAWEYAEMIAGSRTHARPTAVHARIHAMQTKEFNMPPPVCKRDLLRRCWCRRKGLSLQAKIGKCIKMSAEQVPSAPMPRKVQRATVAGIRARRGRHPLQAVKRICFVDVVVGEKAYPYGQMWAEVSRHLLT